MIYNQDSQTSSERLREELDTIRKARNAWPDDSQFALLCNRTMDRLREYVDAMSRAQSGSCGPAFSPWARRTPFTWGDRLPRSAR